MSRARASRRRFLRGLGVTLALPWLETPRLRADEEPESSSSQSDGPPRRFACLFMANGVNPKGWGADGDGTKMVLKEALAPLEPMKEHLMVLNGLYNPNAKFGNIHIGAAPNVLSGARVHKSMTECRSAFFSRDGERWSIVATSNRHDPPYTRVKILMLRQPPSQAPSIVS